MTVVNYIPSNYDAVRELRWHKFDVLNDGFITLVDVMGDDQAVVQAARTSYGEGTHKTSDDRTLLRYLMRHRHCYDDQTEVLTDRGFMKWSDVYATTIDAEFLKTNKHAYKRVPTDIKLGCWDPILGSLVYEKPEYLTADEYSGSMYTVNAQQIDLMVTPEHSMYASIKRWSKETNRMHWTEPCLLPASLLGNRAMVRYYKSAPYTVAEPFVPEQHGFDSQNAETVLNFCGFFIGDGTHSSTNTVSFNIRKKRKIDYLNKLCAILGWECYQLESGSWCVKSNNIGHICKSLFYDSDSEKCIPKTWKLSQPESLALLDGLRNSDGTHKRSTWVYHTTSKRLLEDFQILAIHAGLTTSPSTHYEASDSNAFGGKSRKTSYRIMVLAKGHSPIINQGIESRGQNQVSSTEYNGLVFCAKTRTGVLVVRRNGKIVLSGNSTPFEMAEIKLLVRVPMDCWRQWIRTRTASVNEYSTRYSIAIDSCQTTPPDQWRTQSTANRQGSSGFVSDQWPKGFELCTDDDGEQYLKIWDDDGKDYGELYLSELTDAGFPPTPGGYLSWSEQAGQIDAKAEYQTRLRFNVAREQARGILPLTTYTEAYWKIDLHNLFHFLNLRMDSHAQEEIRTYATIIGEKIVAKLFPLCWEAFVDYRLNALTLSRLDMLVCNKLCTYSVKQDRSKYFLRVCEEVAKWKQDAKIREREECKAKMIALGVMLRE